MIRWITLLFSVAWPTSLGTAALAARNDSPGISTATADTLKSPPILRNHSTAPRTVEVTLTAAPGRLALMPGKVTDVYAFNGSVPGPTLVVREGDRVIVHYSNNLPESSGIHWHGLHLPANMDGSPLFPVPPGGKKDYIFTMEPGTAGTYWYSTEASSYSRPTIHCPRCPRSC
jgi:suppressor of ftsI